MARRLSSDIFAAGQACFRIISVALRAWRAVGSSFPRLYPYDFARRGGKIMLLTTHRARIVKIISLYGFAFNAASWTS